MQFVQLLNPFVLDPDDCSAVGRQQQIAAIEFPKLISNSKMRYWSPGLEFATVGRRFLIGLAASFDIKDLRIADLIERHWIRDPMSSIDVFNIDDCTCIDDLKQYYPGLGNAFPATPILGLWENGVMTELLFGLAARLRVLGVLGLERNFAGYFGDLFPLSESVFSTEE